MPLATQTPPAAGPTQPTVVLMTAEDYAASPDDGRRTELVKGVSIEMPPTNFLHGIVCANVVTLLHAYVRQHGLGHVTGNDSGVITERDPDSVRGPDVAFFIYARLPADYRGAEYPPVSPDLVVEVRSPSDRWREVTAKALEYLAADVRLVAVLDPAAGTLTVFTDDAGPKTLSGDDEFTTPDILPGFAVRVRQLLA